MSSPFVPTKRRRSSSSNSKKRKRSSSLPKPEPSSDNDGVFRSHSSHKAAQLELAGASDTDAEPAFAIPDFPHRGFGRRGDSTEPEEEQGGSEGDVEVEGDKAGAQEGVRRAKPRPRENDRKGHLDTMLRAIEQFLDQGEIRRAARAYGLVLQLRPRSLPIDVRSYNLWAMGAEILMRQGEEHWQRGGRAGHDNEEEDDDGAAQEAFPHGGFPRGTSRATRKPVRRRWGSAANMGRVRAYFETLIRQFPYDRRFPDAVSAADFWLALLSCEVYNTHAEYVAGLSALDDDDAALDLDCDREADERGFHDETTTYYGEGDADSGDRSQLGGGGSSSSGGAYFGHLGDIGSYPSPQKSTFAKRKDGVRALALESMRDIIQRLEKLMEDSPYAKNEHFLRLRATASLFAADLCVPFAPVLPMQRRQAETRRALEQRAAVDAIRELRGARADGTAPAADAHLDAYYLKEEHAMSRPTTLYSSLPIRE